MEQFSLEEWLQDKSHKVVTRQGKPVRIICTDRKHSESWPIVALESYDSGEFVLYANDKGRTDLANENIHDLFFADEEEELTEFEQEIKNWMSEFLLGTEQPIPNKAVKQATKRVWELARKEIEPEFEAELDKAYKCADKVQYEKGKQDALKDLPKWKKITKQEQKYLAFGFLSWDDYYLSIDELKQKLPKEE